MSSNQILGRSRKVANTIAPILLGGDRQEEGNGNFLVQKGAE